MKDVILISENGLFESINRGSSDKEQLPILFPPKFEIGNVKVHGSSNDEQTFNANDVLSEMEQHDFECAIMEETDKRLPKRDRNILYRYYRLGNSSNTDDIARDYHISPERVRRITRRYEQLLKTYVKARNISWAA